MDCKLIGSVYQTLEITLSPHKSFYAERGAMIYIYGQWYKPRGSDELVLPPPPEEINVVV